MDTKLEEFRSRIETIDKKEEAAETLAKQNQNSVSNLTSESPVLQEELAEQFNKNFRDTLVTRGIKEKNQEKTWNTTPHKLSSSLCGLF